MQIVICLGTLKVHERGSKQDASPRRQVPLKPDSITMCSEEEFDEYIADMILQLARIAAQVGRDTIAKELMALHISVTGDRR